jgi:hypothetical protein
MVTLALLALPAIAALPAGVYQFSSTSAAVSLRHCDYVAYATPVEVRRWRLPGGYALGYCAG